MDKFRTCSGMSYRSELYLSVGILSKKYTTRSPRKHRHKQILRLRDINVDTHIYIYMKIWDIFRPSSFYQEVVRFCGLLRVSLSDFAGRVDVLQYQKSALGVFLWGALGSGVPNLWRKFPGQRVALANIWRCCDLQQQPDA